MKRLLAVVFCLSIFFPVNSAAEERTQTIQVNGPFVRKFLEFYVDPNSPPGNRQALPMNRGANLAASATFMAQMYILSCEIVGAKELFDFALGLEPGNPYIMRIRDEGGAYLVERSRELRIEARELEKVSLDQELAATLQNGLDLPALLNLNESRLHYKEAYECDKTNVDALVGYERTAKRQYRDRYVPGALTQKFPEP